MSEGPEVKITAEKLCKAICGKTIDKVYCKTTIGNEFANKIRGLMYAVLRHMAKTWSCALRTCCFLLMI